MNTSCAQISTKDLGFYIVEIGDSEMSILSCTVEAKKVNTAYVSCCVNEYLTVTALWLRKETSGRISSTAEL